MQKWNIPTYTKGYSSSLLHAIAARIHLSFFKIFSNFVHFCPKFQIFCPFLLFVNSFSLLFWNVSSNINEVIKEVISSLFIFFMKRFYTQKKHKMQTSHFHSDIFIRLKSIKSKQTTFTHKKHKTSSKLRFRRF